MGKIKVDLDTLKLLTIIPEQILAGKTPEEAMQAFYDEIDNMKIT